MPLTEIVTIILARGDDGKPDRAMPFAVACNDDSRTGLYDDEPGVLAQLAPGEVTARFEATWDGEWKFGRRAQDA
jgi:hypothetical protein